MIITEIRSESNFILEIEIDFSREEICHHQFDNPWISSHYHIYDQARSDIRRAVYRQQIQIRLVIIISCKSLHNSKISEKLLRWFYWYDP